MTQLGQWTPPWDTAVAASFERVSTSHLRSGGCAEQAAKKARPEVWPSAPAEFIESQRGDFPLSLARDAVLSLLATPPAADADPDVAIADAVRSVADASNDEWHPLSLQVAGSAVSGYLRVRDQLAKSGELPASRAFADIVGMQDGPVPLEFYAWGIWHLADEGRLREIHLPRWQSAGTVRLDDAAVALAAMITATGVIATSKPMREWSRPYLPAGLQPPQQAERIRVRIIGMIDGTESVRFDGTVDEAIAAFDADSVPAFAQLSGGSFRPSRGCAGCSLRRHCPALPHRPGLLGVTGYTTATKSITPSDLTAYRMCPERLWLERDLGLPPRRDVSAAQRRGVQVHEWLASAHTRGVPCSSTDLFDPADLDLDAALPASAGIAHDLSWTSEEYAENLPYLLAHLDNCPMGEHVVTATSEHTMTAWDTDANVVASTRVDLAYSTDDGRTHLRETKTLNMDRLPENEADLLWHFPQVAMSVCLLADDPDLSPGRVELELLSERAGTVVPFDAADAATVLAARTALADTTDQWLHDTTHAPRHNPPCRWCPMRGHCPDASSVEVAFPSAGGDAIDVHLDTADWTVQALQEATAAPEEEDFPF